MFDMLTRSANFCKKPKPLATFFHSLKAFLCCAKELQARKFHLRDKQFSYLLRGMHRRRGAIIVSAPLGVDAAAFTCASKNIGAMERSRLQHHDILFALRVFAA
jgi:hypothetical protein